MKKVLEEEFEPFNISLSDEKAPKVGDGWKVKDIEEWSWLDFFNYFEAEYQRITKKKHWYNMKQKGAKKSIIEKSFGHWGKPLFKAMIDWLFVHYREHPEWNDLTIGLVCGAHVWAKEIAREAKTKMDLDSHWN